jgi:hypothetical protein
MNDVDPSVLDSLYRCLANERRRFVLSYLLAVQDRPVSVDELVEAVTDADSRPTSPDTDGVEVTLHHAHLPILAEAGLVNYDRSRGVVTKTSRCASVEPYLDLVDNLDRTKGSVRGSS